MHLSSNFYKLHCYARNIICNNEFLANFEMSQSFPFLMNMSSWIFTLQLTSVSHCCLSTTLLRGWLSWSSVSCSTPLLLGGLSVSQGGFRVVLGRYCCSLFWFCPLKFAGPHLPVQTGKYVDFVENMFTMTSAAVENILLEKYFPPDVARCCYEARHNIMRLRPVSVW